MGKRKRRRNFGECLSLIILDQVIFSQFEPLFLAYTLGKFCLILSPFSFISHLNYLDMFTIVWIFVKTRAILYVETKQNFHIFPRRIIRMTI